MAVEIGDNSAGRRAVFGVSPGDDNHDEPYVYVALTFLRRGLGELRG